MSVGAHRLEGRMHAAKLDRRLLLKFLNEVAAPGETRAEGGDLSRPVAAQGLVGFVEFLHAMGSRSVNLTCGERPVREVCTEARAVTCRNAGL